MSRASEYRRLRNGGKCRPEGDNFSVEERRKERYAELKISRKGPDYVVKRAVLKGAMLNWVLLRQNGVMLNSDAVMADGAVLDSDAVVAEGVMLDSDAVLTVWLVLLGLVSMRLYDRG